MPTSTVGSDRASVAGFTLVELLAALALLALAAGIVLGDFTRATDRFAAGHLAVATAQRARNVRSDAIRTGRDRVLVIDTANRRIGGDRDKSPVVFGPDVNVGVTVSASERATASLAAIRFFSNGMSTGGTIRFGQLGRVYEVRVNWFNGRVSIAPAG